MLRYGDVCPGIIWFIELQVLNLRVYIYTCIQGLNASHTAVKDYQQQ